MKLLASAAAIFALTVSVSASAAGHSAPTADQVKAAAGEFDAGRRAYRDGDYALAAEHFEAADADAPNPDVMELAIRSRDKAGQLDRAATLAAMALQRDPNAQNIKKVAGPILRRAATLLGRINVHCSSPCDLVVGSRLVYGRASKEKTVYVKPGAHTLRAGWSHKRNAGHRVQVAKGAAVDLSFQEPPLPSSASPALPGAGPGVPPAGGGAPAEGRTQLKPRSGWSPLVFLTGVGLTAALGGVTIWSGIDTQNNPGASKVKQDCVNQGTSCPEYQQGLSSQRRTNILAAVTGGVAVVTAAIGLFATDWSGAPQADQGSKKVGRAYSIEPWIGLGDGATLGATGRF